MHLSILRSGVLLTLAALGVAAATAQPEFPFAVGVDSTGWAQAQSNAEGQVIFELPEYPRGLWLDLVDEAGDALAGLQVEYQGRPNGLVALRCVDPAGLWRETLLWTRPSGDPIRLTLRPRETADLSAGLVPIDWQIDPAAEVLLESTEATRLIGWQAVSAFLRGRWQGQAGRGAVQLDGEISFAVEMDHPDAVEMLMAYLQQLHQSAGASLGETTPLKVQVFEGSLALREGVILYTFSFEDSNLETMVRRALGRPHGPITRQEVTSLTEIQAYHSTIHSLVGLEHFAALEWLDLYINQIADVSPLAPLTNLKSLYLGNNQIADVEPLAPLTNLYKLDLYINQIADVSPLAALTNLKSLHLGNNQIADVEPLTALTNLKSLYLYNNQIADVSPLAPLTNLEWLHLYINQIAGVEPLAPLTNLKSLYLYNNQIADVSPLAPLTNLKSLHLGNNQIADVSPLAALTNLEWLALYNNQIADVSPLIANTGLGEGDVVDLIGNPLSDQALTEQIPALKARGVLVYY